MSVNSSPKFEAEFNFFCILHRDWITRVCSFFSIRQYFKAHEKKTIFSITCKFATALKCM